MNVSDAKHEPREAASVLLLRDGVDGVQIYLLRRHRKASFMASSFVFPGGITDPQDGDLRVTAVRELFEESGVLLTKETTTTEQREQWREAINTDHADFSSTVSVPLDLGALHYFAQWITPSVEKRRYCATFYVALMPANQQASPDNMETVDEVWISPAEALERSDELHLPPPQLRSLLELLESSKKGITEVLEEVKRRADEPHPMLPRACSGAAELTLLLPWDSEYESKGEGDSMTIEAGHALAWGPSRFVLRDARWKHE